MLETSEKHIPKVSIIVPVHNAGERLYKCLDTLVNQTLREIEMILVLDCPTDGSDRIAEEYAAKDDRIVILKNTENLHIGQSRNRGLEMARGEFIGFSDHDDYRELNMYETLYREAKIDDSDLVVGVNFYFDKRVTISKIPDNLSVSEKKDFLLQDLIADGDDESAIPVATNVHPNLYKTSFLRKEKIVFADTRQYSPEDRIFQIHCLLYAEKIRIVSDRFYYHILHESSAVNDSNYKSCFTRAKGKELIYNLLKESGCFDVYKDFFYSSVKKEFTECLLNSLIFSGKISVFKRDRAYLKSFPFCYDAFCKAHFSYRKYRPGGKISRFVIILLMKIGFVS